MVSWELSGIKLDFSGIAEAEYNIIASACLQANYIEAVIEFFTWK